MDRVRALGIDPGIVDTGMVYLCFDRINNEIFRGVTVVNRAKPEDVAMWAESFTNHVPEHTFIEGYRPRSHYGTDEHMVELVREIHQALPGSKVIPNMGVKKLVTQQLLELCGCWVFNTPTHHDDLRSAARILLLGMFKNPMLNTVVADMVRDAVAGNPWSITHI